MSFVLRLALEMHLSSQTLSFKLLLLFALDLNFCFCVASTLLTTYLTFYQINCNFSVAIVLLVDFFIYLNWMFTFKSAHGFHTFTKMRRSFSSTCFGPAYHTAWAWNQSQEHQEILSNTHHQTQEQHAILLRSF